VEDQALIWAYLSNGLRKYLAERGKASAVEKFSERLRVLRVEERVIQEAAG
jgi:hypothetical protein